jgi:hypothetical protein
MVWPGPEYFTPHLAPQLKKPILENWYDEENQRYLGSKAVQSKWKIKAEQNQI